MNILAAGAARGGVADVFARTVRELRARGHAVTILEVPGSGVAAFRSALRARAAIARADAVHLEFGSNDSAAFWFALAAVSLRAGCTVIAHDPPELAHAPRAGLLADQGRLPRAIGLRLLPPALDREAVRRLLRRAGVVVVLGESARSELLGRGASRVAVIRHGTDPPRSDLMAPSHGRSVLFAGYIGPSKGLDVLLEAWATLPAPVPLPLVLAGAAEPPYDAWLAERLPAARTGPGRIEVLGSVAGEEGFQRVVESAAIVVLPYRRSSPASGILLRAMRAGRAIVATPVPAVREALVDGRSALLVPIGDTGALRDALARLLGDPAERDRLGAAAAQAARAFSWEAHIAGLEAAYGDAAKAREPG